MADQNECRGRQFHYSDPAELLKEAKDREAEAKKVVEKKKGLDFMGLRLCIIDKRHELLISKSITPSESLLLEKIELGTIAARNGKSQICSKAEFFLDDLADGIQVRKNKIYVMLKSLHSKNLILRIPTRSKGREIIGLNPEVFGQILIDTHHQFEEKRFLKLVQSGVDNSQNGVNYSKKKVPNQDASSPESGLKTSQIGTNPLPNQDQFRAQNPLLDSSKSSLNSLKGKTEKGESSTLQGKSEAEIEKASREKYQRQRMEMGV